MEFTMKETTLISIWRAEKCSGVYIGHHSHQYHELVYYPRGRGTTEIGNVTYSFADGCFAMISPGISHNESHHASGEVICLEFVGDSELIQGLYRDTDGKVYRTLREILDEVRLQDAEYREMISAKMCELMVHIHRICGSVAEEKSFEYIINYLRENYHEKIILSDCARQIDLSYDYFQHKFKSITGMSPQQYLVEQRLIAAESMIRQGSYNCTEIAFRCGFSTSAQFSALFKRRYGLSPLAYRHSIAG
jgi:AraC-like DNA-binding protein